MISAYKEESINDLVLYHINDDDSAIPIDIKHNEGVRRQDHSSVYVRNGAIYITKVKYIKSEKKIISDFPLIYKMSKNSSINIDTFDDLELVRSLLCK